jgi:hypothetical protein
MYGKELQEAVIKIQNVGSSPVKLNITVPKTKYFRIREDQRNFTLSAGMPKKIVIELVKLPQDRSCLDFVLVQS